MERPSLLIIESNDWDREQIRSCITGLSTTVHCLRWPDVAEARAQVDIVILGFSDAVSLKTSRSQLEHVRAQSPHSQLILCAPRDADGIDQYVLELKARAFVLKPVDAGVLSALLEETIAQIQRRREREAWARASRKSTSLDDVIGDSTEIRAVLELIRRVSQSATTSVLMLGESGVGKSHFARSVHDLSERASGPFIELNCAALPEQLLESELFGYEPGAFTDARSRKIGLIELADAGTLFLDEVTEMAPVTQAKLLKFLDTKRLRRLGGKLEIGVDVRIVAASNRDIRAEVHDQKFREDLYYRLNVVEIVIPPLRERSGDIDLVADHYLSVYRAKFKKNGLEFSAGARRLIRDYAWPGNVRELIHVIERAALLCPGDEITAEHLPLTTAPPGGRRLATVTRGETSLEVSLPDGSIRLDDLERAAIEAVLRRTRGNVSRAAEMLGLSRGALRSRLSRHRIDPHRFHRPATLLEV